jgi:holo-[acyl-carrier protein] synthase
VSDPAVGTGAGVDTGGYTTAGILGVGVDAVDVERFDQLLERRPNIAVRIFTPAEQSVAEGAANRAQMLAARFAAKEALMKSLGVGIGAFPLWDVEVVRTAGSDATRHAPYFVLHGQAADLAARSGVSRFHLSMSHTDDLAIAFVVAEASPSPSPFSES